MRRLVCHVLLLLAACLSHTALAQPLQFRWLAPCEGLARACTQRLLARGDIEWDSAAALKAFLAAEQVQPQPGRGRIEVCFDSPGGDMYGAFQLGELIRATGLDTCVERGYPPATGQGPAVPAVCASACVFAFAGGVHRMIGPGAVIGVHQFSAGRGELGQRRTQLAMTEL